MTEVGGRRVEGASVEGAGGEGVGAVSAAPSTRLSKASRRDQLLDSAAELLLRRGTNGITMEGLAAQAGVSKALPYVHFDNAEHVLLELYRRELQGFGERVNAAVAQRKGVEARMRAAIHTYFDVVTERGAILSMLAGPGSCSADPCL